MQHIPLNQFEQYINDTILTRGLSYFNKGYVREPEEISPGEYEIIVEGSEEYVVELIIKNGTVLEYYCDCPFESNMCKHIAAAFFYVQKDVLELDIKSPSKKGKRISKSPKKKTIAEQVNEILEKVSAEELNQFIRDKSKSDASFRNIFLSSFAHLNINEDKEFYAKQIETIINKASGSFGMISWTEGRHLGHAIEELILTAEKHLANNNTKSAVFICCAVIEKMGGIMHYADDSNGDIGGNIEFAFSILLKITKNEISEDVRKFLLEYCIDIFEKRIFSGFDWHLGMLQIASELFSNTEEAEKIIKYLDKAQQSEYETEEAQSIKYEILKKTKGEQQAYVFLMENIYNPILRKTAIEKEIQNKQFGKAIDLAKDGIQFDKSKPGLVLKWYDLLLKIALIQKNKELIIEYARFLFIDHFLHDQDYYSILKKHVSTQNWNAFVEEMIIDIIKKDKWTNTSLISWIYIQEKWWPQLMELVKKERDLYRIEEYEKYLSKDYAPELIQLYADTIKAYLKNNLGRNHYQTACRYLKRMIKLGGKTKAESLIATFRKEYPQRRALMEELKRV